MFFIMIVLILVGIGLQFVVGNRKKSDASYENVVNAAVEEWNKEPSDDWRKRDQIKNSQEKLEKMRSVTKYFGYGRTTAFSLSVLILCLLSYTTVPGGHNKVAVLFGEIKDVPYNEGLNFPVNPLYDWVTYDLRQKTFKAEGVGVPSEDKLITSMDVSVQYRTIGGMTPEILRNTGETQDIIDVHLIPKLRSVLREQGKGVKKAQDFFTDSVQIRLQTTLQSALVDYLAPKGIQIDSVLIRSVVLPKVIRDSIEETKRREQEVLKQQAELDRFAAEQDKKIKTAESEFKAAQLEAQKIRELADAQAYKISEINKQLSKSPEYIELIKAEGWNGVLPTYTGGENIPMIDLRPR